ncbi:MAG: hypothetical protein WEB63_11220 [Cucumibacter sp.]
MATAPGAAEIETANLKARPAVETVRDGAWLASYPWDRTKRATLIQSLAPLDIDDAAARIGRLAGLNRRRSLPPIFRITPFAGPLIETALDTMAWSRCEESLTLVRGLDEAPFDIGASFRRFAPTDKDWIKAQGALHRLGFAETYRYHYRRGQDQ